MLVLREGTVLIYLHIFKYLYKDTYLCIDIYIYVYIFIQITYSNRA